MSQFILAVRHGFPGLCRKLKESAFFFNNEDFRTRITEMMVDGWPHLSFSIQNQNGALKSETLLLVRRRLAELLADYILDGSVPSYIDEIIERQYSYFPRDERREIINFTVKIWQKQKEEDRFICDEVRSLLEMLLAQQDYLNIHGLVVFRLDKRQAALRRCLDQAVDEFLMEKEYQEFLKLLKYFVQFQEPKVYQVHVALDQQGNLFLLDQNYNYIEGPKQNADWDDPGGDKDDLLISMLIAVAPQKIVLHRQVHVHYPKATDTLKHVFEKRVNLCRRCKICHESSGIINLKGKY